MTVIPLFPHKEQIPRPNGGAADGTEGAKRTGAALGAKHESTAVRKDEQTLTQATTNPRQGGERDALPAGIKPCPSILNYDALSELFSYDPHTGFVTWLVDYGTAKAGDRAGTKRPSGYRMIQVHGRRYQEHRIAWVLANGQLPADGFQIDHVNRTKDDNRLLNLRAATRAQQQINSPTQKNNRYGRGVSWRADRKKWRAEIYVDGRSISLGHYDHQKDAQSAYVSAAREYYGEFAAGQALPVDTYTTHAIVIEHRGTIS